MTFLGAGLASRAHGSDSPQLADVFRRISSHFDRKGVFSVLDFGCGTGLLCRHISESFPLIRIEGCDSSPEAVETTRNNCPWGVFYVADADSAKLAHYDVIVARDSLGSMTDVPAVIRKLDSHLYPGGRFIIAYQAPASAVREQVMRTLTESGYSVSFEEFKSEPAPEERNRLLAALPCLRGPDRELAYDRTLRPESYWIVSALKQTLT
jgi:trans-aconitate methyltransferase